MMNVSHAARYPSRALAILIVVVVAAGCQLVGRRGHEIIYGSGGASGITFRDGPKGEDVPVSIPLSPLSYGDPTRNDRFLLFRDGSQDADWEIQINDFFGEEPGTVSIETPSGWMGMGTIGVDCSLSQTETMTSELSGRVECEAMPTADESRLPDAAALAFDFVARP